LDAADPVGPSPFAPAPLGNVPSLPEQANSTPATVAPVIKKTLHFIVGPPSTTRK
jgi:hypothetical protein